MQGSSQSSAVLKLLVLLKVIENCKGSLFMWIVLLTFILLEVKTEN